jgi:hypothetical protein
MVCAELIFQLAMATIDSRQGGARNSECHNISWETFNGDVIFVFLLHSGKFFKPQKYTLDIQWFNLKIEASTSSITFYHIAISFQGKLKLALRF